MNTWYILKPCSIKFFPDCRTLKLLNVNVIQQIKIMAPFYPKNRGFALKYFTKIVQCKRNGSVTMDKASVIRDVGRMLGHASCMQKFP